MRRCRRLLALSRTELWTLGQAAALLPIFALLLRAVRLETLLARLKRCCPAPREFADQGAARSVAQLVNAAARHRFFRAPCLERSLVLWWLLRQRGVGATLQIGVRKEAERLEAHAWVELDGVVLNDRPDIAGLFAPLPGLDRERSS